MKIRGAELRIISVMKDVNNRFAAASAQSQLRAVRAELPGAGSGTAGIRSVVFNLQGAEPGDNRPEKRKCFRKFGPFPDDGIHGFRIAHSLALGRGLFFGGECGRLFLGQNSSVGSDQERVTLLLFVAQSGKTEVFPFGDALGERRLIFLLCFFLRIQPAEIIPAAGKRQKQ